MPAVDGATSAMRMAASSRSIHNSIVRLCCFGQRTACRWLQIRRRQSDNRQQIMVDIAKVAAATCIHPRYANLPAEFQEE